ncbi:glycosyl hydrolase family 28-related protein [Paenibacillus sp. UMB7766-LJ446]|uniref:right-handed parallel beta-helix repeat-containing protein n=1 Tax=Paenibacillus sp. UMB7766-LJ446 TaxID=3046313 RepID=UPI002550112E|nr:right-handed parallel beta-helix repeat-containing protein [Paenibacillus sp. UMB7766-LJ446]MDK8193773.1 glycosyl hydrolase family 28-related protein [Paenibacillus sp. UMB7766-LJ446]
MNRYPWRDTSVDIAGGQPPQWETPGGAQDKVDEGIDKFSNLPEIGVVDGSITTPKIRDNNVVESKIANQAVTQTKLAPEAVTNEKLANESVDTSKIQNNSITTPKIQNDSVVTEKIKDENITLSKLSPESKDASNHTYSGLVDASTVKGAIDTTSNRVEYFIAHSGDSVVEIVDARISSSGTVYPTMRARLDTENSEVTSELAGKAKKQWIDITEFGVIGDGVTDDSAAFARAVEAMGDGDCVLFLPPKKYLISPSGAGGILIKDKANFTVIGYGAEVFCNPIVVTNSTPNYRLVRIRNCSNFKVLGINFKYQVSWDSVVTSGASRDEQLFEVWADRGEKCDNFEISSCGFEFSGKSLNYYPDNITNRLSILLLASQTSDGIYDKLITNFSIHHNTFVNCVGRTIYTLLAKTGNISNNTFLEFGKQVNDDGTYKGFAESIGLRALACEDVNVVGNTINCVTDVLPNMADMGSVRIFYTGNGGLIGQFSKNIKFANNIVNMGKVGGILLQIGDSEKVTFENNQAMFEDTPAPYNTYAVRSEETGYKKDIMIRSNMFTNPQSFYYLESGLDVNYSNWSVKDNTHISGNNTLVYLSTNTAKRTYFGKNYWSDKNAECLGSGRQREISAYRMPPLTGSFTAGDICINTGFDAIASPVTKWVYQYNSSGTNWWRPIEWVNYRNNTPPTMPTTDAEKLQFMGLQFIDTSATTDGKLATWTGLKWVWADGTARP